MYYGKKSILHLKINSNGSHLINCFDNFPKKKLNNKKLKEKKKKIVAVAAHLHVYSFSLKENVYYTDLLELTGLNCT